MSVRCATAPSVSIPTPATPLLHIRTDPYSGRKYHASTALPENADLLGVCAPYSYTIWKRFRNEVCAECWRYDGGRRSFLTRRDDQDLADPSKETEGEGGSDSTENQPRKPGRGANASGAGSIGAGLWFCDGQCQRSWVAREGIDAVDLLRLLEAARQKKPKPKPRFATDSDAQQAGEREITQEAADRAWDGVRKKERSLKEVRRWRDMIQLDDYETDMARYVLLALLHYHREQCDRTRLSPCYRQPSESPQKQSNLSDASSESQENNEKKQGSEWETLSSLQTNELSLLRACPEILVHQTRIYQLLKARFGAAPIPAAHPVEVPTTPSRSCASAAHSPNGTRTRPTEGDSSRDTGDSGSPPTTPELADVVTIANVRTVLGVDPGNAFGIWEVPLMEESECLGFAVYPVASFFNHHCSPNVRKGREGRSLRFSTICMVDDGQELCISYGYVEGMDWATRQKELFEGWYFKCKCSRCTAEEPGREPT